MGAKKVFILISVFSFIFLITGLTFAQDKTQESAPSQTKEQVSAQPEAEAPAKVEATTTAAPAEKAKTEPEIQWVWGEIISTNPINNELLVKYVDYDTDSEKEITISTDNKTTYENAKSIDEIKVGNSVSVDYAVSVDGKNLALNISLEKPEVVSTPEEGTSAPGMTPAEVPNQENTEAAPNNTVE